LAYTTFRTLRRHWWRMWEGKEGKGEEGWFDPPLPQSTGSFRVKTSPSGSDRVRNTG